MKVSFSLILMLILVGCSGSRQSVNKTSKIEVKSATVQKMVPGIEQGEITFVFLLDFSLDDKSYKADSILFNTHSTKLFLVGKNGYYKAQVAFTQDELTKLNSESFTTNEAVITFTNGTNQFEFNLTDIKILEDTYMP